MTEIVKMALKWLYLKASLLPWRSIQSRSLEAGPSFSSSPQISSLSCSPLQFPGLAIIFLFFSFFKYTVHWIDIKIVYKIILPIALSPLALHLANCIPYATFPIPMTIGFQTYLTLHVLSTPPKPVSKISLRNNHHTCSLRVIIHFIVLKIKGSEKSCRGRKRLLNVA